MKLYVQKSSSFQTRHCVSKLFIKPTMQSSCFARSHYAGPNLLPPNTLFTFVLSFFSEKKRVICRDFFDERGIWWRGKMIRIYLCATKCGCIVLGEAVYLERSNVTTSITIKSSVYIKWWYMRHSILLFVQVCAPEYDDYRTTSRLFQATNGSTEDAPFIFTVQ